MIFRQRYYKKCTFAKKIAESLLSVRFFGSAHTHRHVLLCGSVELEKSPASCFFLNLVDNFLFINLAIVITKDILKYCQSNKKKTMKKNRMPMKTFSMPVKKFRKTWRFLRLINKQLWSYFRKRHNRSKSLIFVSLSSAYLQRIFCWLAGWDGYYVAL